MQAMAILKRVRNAENELARIRQMIRQRRDMLDSIGAPALNPNGGGHGTPDPDKNGRIYGDIDELERELKKRQERIAAEMASGLALIDMAPEQEGKVLYRYYLKKMNTREIATSLHYTDGYIRRLKRQGEEIMRMLSPDKVASTLPPWYLREYGG